MTILGWISDPDYELDVLEAESLVERPCHFCERRESYRRVEADGRTVWICDVCWEKAA